MSAQPTDPAAPEAPTKPVRRRMLMLIGVAVLVLGLDVLSKVLVVANIRYGDSVRLLGGALYLVQARNPGAAFSVGTGATILLTALAVIVAGVIIRQARRLYSLGWAIALGLILGGALGNLSDRLLRAPGFGRGYVVDWISVFASDGHIWPIFNLADSSIVCGAILAAMLSVLGISLDGRRGAGDKLPGEETARSDPPEHGAVRPPERGPINQRPIGEERPS